VSCCACGEFKKAINAADAAAAPKKW